MNNTLRIATFNIHKGLSHFNARFVLHHQRDLLRKLHADIIFLQEVQEAHGRHHKYLTEWALSGQLAYLAHDVWAGKAYGKNAEYPAGHHGNAVLSKYPITLSVHQNISAHPVEQRGLLHCEINMPGWQKPLHALCLHLGLTATWRRRQLRQIADYINAYIPLEAPLIVAGDFNDWSGRAGTVFAEHIGLREVFEHHTGKLARSFPAWLPMLRMDRIYVRGFDVTHTEVHAGPHFIKLSDHAILTTTLRKI